MGCVQSMLFVAGYVPANDPKEHLHENPSHSSAGAGADCVLFFPDPAMPCRHAQNCHRKHCTFSHERTSLVQVRTSHVCAAALLLCSLSHPRLASFVACAL